MRHKFYLALLLGLLLSAALSPAAAFGKRCAAARSGVLRLHILAASDSASDQADKLAVRDALLAYTEPMFEGCSGLAETEAAVRDALPGIEAEADRVLESRGSADRAQAKLVRMWFETRSYGDLTLPAGTYTALRVSIGAAQGKNWWCVLFPQLCVGTASQRQQAERAFEEMGIEPTYKLGFAGVELVERMLEILRQKGLIAPA